MYYDSGIDVNSDGLFNSLKVAAGINLTSAGLFRLAARSKDNTLNEITYYNKELILSQGVQTIDITFDGLKIPLCPFARYFVVKLKSLNHKGSQR